VIVGRRNAISLTEPKRTNPIELDSNTVKETITFNLPAGFVVDELPDPVNLDTQFGKYSTTLAQKEGKRVFTRMITMNRTLVSPDKYPAVKDFYKKMLEADQSPVVLIRK
jgi:hypothetical protein